MEAQKVSHIFFYICPTHFVPFQLKMGDFGERNMDEILKSSSVMMHITVICVWNSLIQFKTFHRVHLFMIRIFWIIARRLILYN